MSRDATTLPKDESKDNELEFVLQELKQERSEKLFEEYIHGHHPGLLSYEKVFDTYKGILPIQKYFIGAMSYWIQPTPYSDYYRNSRIATLLQLLGGIAISCG